MAEWIEFVEQPRDARETSYWVVYPKDPKGGHRLGEVKWWGAWRRYCFFPAPETLFEPTCLRDIADFLASKTRYISAIVAQGA